MLCRLKIQIFGIVQGVGMRPTIYRHAMETGITGLVNNTPEGVFIEAQGQKDQLQEFLNLLSQAPPPQAKIDKIESYETSIVNNETNFEIILSNHLGNKNTDISPDLATCTDCLKDIQDPENRRFGYAFTNCTNCGPRFTIIEDRPYDRPLTSMKDFPMCDDCKEEYDNPLDRRFHAQPNACPICGPKLSILGNESKDPLLEIIDQIKNNKIVAIKGLGGFNIACLPSGKALNKLREVKNRPTKSFALMAKNLEVIKNYAELSLIEEEELSSSIAPIVLLKKKENIGALDKVSPDNNYLGFMLPYTPLHHLLMQNFETLIMTSANLKDEPIAISDKEVMALIDKGVIDYALTHNREVAHRADDSIVQFIKEKKQIIRRSRGIVPMPISTEKKESSNALCLGANMKNTFSLRKDDKVYLSQHIGELIDLRNYEFQHQEIKDLENLLDIKTTEINSDAHPGYENYNPNNTLIYHHHAHLLSVIGEHQVNPADTLGIICDGTGFGTDETIWGFEFLKPGSNNNEFKRLAHLKPFRLPGSEIALKEVDRIKISLLNSIGESIDDIESDRKKNILMLLDKNLNSPMTSSLGRLFDGIASILGITDRSGYEAQAAILLQKEAENYLGSLNGLYPVNIKTDQTLIIEYEDMLRALLNDIKNGVSRSECAYKFHQWVCDSILKVIEMLNPKSVCLSGGCFQNRLLMELLIDSLEEKNINYYTNHLVPVNDAGISFGQAMI